MERGKIFVYWKVSLLFLLTILFQSGNSFRSLTLHPSSIFISKGLMVSTATATSETTSPRKPQVLSFIEPSTNVTVVLLGSMHYNPRSIELAQSTIQQYAERGELASVIIESCEVRWKRTLDLLGSSSTTNPTLLQTLQKQWKQFTKEKLFYNEMYAAEEAAKRYNIPVILGDQLINITTANIGKGFKQTIRDISQPLQGGWERIKTDFTQTYPITMPSGEGYLGPEDFLNLQLLLATPVTLFRYPLSLALRAPLLLLPVLFSALTAELPSFFQFDSSSVLSSDGLSAFSGYEQFTEPIINISGLILASVVFPLFEFVILGRLFLIHILAERNVVLAERILQQCQMITNENDRSEIESRFIKTKNSNSFFQKLTEFLPWKPVNTLFQGKGEEQDFVKEAVVSDSAFIRKEKVVIAVLGMAHCNGIKKLLTSSMIEIPNTPAPIASS